MTTYLTPEQIQAKQQATADANKKVDEPDTLTDADLPLLPVETFSRLAEAALQHLGIGRPRGTRRTGR